MQFELVIFLAINLLISPTVSSLKLPNPSAPTVLIVNHLNYLRYDYFSSPTGHRSTGYPFYSSLNGPLNNRSDGYSNRYQLNRTVNNLDLILNGQLDVELADNGAIVQSSNEDFNNNNLANNDLNEQSTTSVNITEQSTNIIRSVSPQIRQSNDEPNDVQLVDKRLDDGKSSDDTNEASQKSSNSNNNNRNNNDELSDLIITNSIEGQHRLLELNLLQQTEPSLSLILDAESPFLNDVHQDFNLPSKSTETTEQTPIEPANNNTLNNYLPTEHSSGGYIQDNLDDLLDIPDFDLIEFTKSDDENLNSLPDSSSDLFLPENIDDLANELNFYENVDLLNIDDAIVNQNDNLQLLIAAESSTVDNFSNVLNQDLCMNDEDIYKKYNNSIKDEATCSASAAINPAESDYYIREYLADEDLQLIGFQSLQSPICDDTAEASGINDLSDNLTNEDRIEVSSDSAISSMSRSDWFDSGSDSSSHFDDQFVSQQEHCLDNDQQQRTRCVSSNSNSNALFDEFNLIDSNYDLYSRDDVFDDPILNFEDTASRLNPISFTSQNFNQITPQQAVLHNHTYTSARNPENDAVTSSISKTQSRSTTSGRSNRAQSELLEEIRNNRMLEQSTASHNFDLVSLTSETSSGEGEMSRSMSRDEKKAKELQIPISVCEIINMPIDEFNECLSKHELNEAQLTLIRDIRRRGKNKVAAQNCRKRKINQIFGLQSEVDQLQLQKNDLYSYHERMLAAKSLAENKYQKLYDFIFERTQDNAALLANFEMNFRMSNVKRNNSDDEGAVGGDESKFDENNTNQLNEMSSTGELLMLKNLTKMDIKPNHKANYKKALAMN